MQDPTVNTDQALIDELTTRAISEIYPSKDALVELLKSGRRLKVYFGIDPTGTDIHVGHQSQLLKLKRLQDLGHEITLLIGDFTAMIGDPTDKSAARVKQTREEVLANAADYIAQAGRILNIDDEKNPVKVAYNSEWLGKMNFADVLELASEFTVQQMLERNMFRKRLDENKPVGVHEFIYPMMQGWDSVCLDVDIEIGGSDQIFNMLVGTTLVKRHKNKQKFVIAGQLLVDPSGKKIGKTEGNMITLSDTPLDMFHKIMLWGDTITPHALELCSKLPMSEIKELEAKLASGEMTGLQGKTFLAKTIVTDLHGPEAAEQAEAEYRNLTSNVSTDIDRDILTQFAVTTDSTIVQILVDSGLTTSNRAARQLLSDRAVKVDGEVIDETWKLSEDNKEVVLQVGKKKLENHRLLKLS